VAWANIGDSLTILHHGRIGDFHVAAIIGDGVGQCVIAHGVAAEIHTLTDRQGLLRLLLKHRASDYPQTDHGDAEMYDGATVAVGMGLEGDPGGLDPTFG